MKSIASAPLQFARYEAVKTKNEFRRAIVERLPYLIVYQVLLDEILVVAAAYSSRRPGYWRKRGSQSNQRGARLSTPVDTPSVCGRPGSRGARRPWGSNGWRRTSPSGVFLLENHSHTILQPVQPL